MKVEVSPKWTTLQVSWLVLWVISVILSIIYYVPKVVDATKQAHHACTLSGVGNTLTNLIKPEQWFGLFTIVVTVIGVRLILKKASSKWAWIDDYTLLVVAALLLIILFLIQVGCSR